jgi:hypothetical protein
MALLWRRGGGRKSPDVPPPWNNLADAAKNRATRCLGETAGLDKTPSGGQQRGTIAGSTGARPAALRERRTARGMAVCAGKGCTDVPNTLTIAGAICHVAGAAAPGKPPSRGLVYRNPLRIG